MGVGWCAVRGGSRLAPVSFQDARFGAAPSRSRDTCLGALGSGRYAEVDLREIINAILYVDRTGVQWRSLPHDFPHWNTVYGYFANWQKGGIFAQLNGLLRELVRGQEGAGPSRRPA